MSSGEEATGVRAELGWQLFVDTLVYECERGPLTSELVYASRMDRSAAPATEPVYVLADAAAEVDLYVGEIVVDGLPVEGGVRFQSSG